MQSALMPDGFVLHKLKPDWIGRTTTVSAWFDLEGKMKDGEVLYARGYSRPIKPDSPLWKYAEREGQRFAATLTKSKP